jgi:integral membrane protein
MSTTKSFRLIGFLEGFSFLFLLFVAMPLKYVAGLPQAVRFTGMAHGMLFVGYIIAATLLAGEAHWPRRQRWLAYLAAFLPFGVFVFDRKFFPKKFSEEV